MSVETVWDDVSIKQALADGKDKVRFHGLRDRFHLIGTSLTGVLVKNIHGHVKDFPFHEVKSVEER